MSPGFPNIFIGREDSSLSFSSVRLWLPVMLKYVRKAAAVYLPKGLACSLENNLPEIERERESQGSQVAGAASSPGWRAERCPERLHSPPGPALLLRLQCRPELREQLCTHLQEWLPEVPDVLAALHAESTCVLCSWESIPCTRKSPSARSQKQCVGSCLPKGVEFSLFCW